MIEGNPFVDTDSMVPEKGGAAVKSAARSNGNRIANFNWDEAFKGFVLQQPAFQSMLIRN